MTEFETGADAVRAPAEAADAESVLIVTQHVAAPPELVWEFLVDGEKMLRWMGTAVDIDPTPGGKFWLNATGSDIASGTYLALDRPHRVVFTFGWEGSEDVAPGSTTVTITLRAAADETTMIELRHDGLPGGAGDQHREGWTHFLGRLGVIATGGELDDDGSHP